MLVHRGEHQGRVSSWGLTRKGNAAKCQGGATSATRGRPVALYMDTAPLRENVLASATTSMVISIVSRLTSQANSLRKRIKKVAVSVVMICSPIRGTLDGARCHGLRVAHRC